MFPIVLVGPTASGKSALALELAARLDAEIVSCDALQIFREADIITAKPTRAERAVVPHHLLDICEPNQRFSAIQWAQRARETIVDIEKRGRRTIICGGTGFYLRAWLEPEAFDAPASDPILRSSLEHLVRFVDEKQRRVWLEKWDSNAATRIVPNDEFRIVRALEIALIRANFTNRELASNHSSTNAWLANALDSLEPIALSSTKERAPLDVAIYALHWERAALYARINARVDEMLELGAEREATELRQKWGDQAPFASGVGYKQLWAFVDERISRAEAIEEWKRESRRYAKRQTTWFKHQLAATWLDAARGAEELADEIGKNVGT